MRVLTAVAATPVFLLAALSGADLLRWSDDGSDRRCTILALLELEQPITERKNCKFYTELLPANSKVVFNLKTKHQKSIPWIKHIAR